VCVFKSNLKRSASYVVAVYVVTFLMQYRARELTH
jgi:hypothetical protein